MQSVIQQFNTQFGSIKPMATKRNHAYLAGRQARRNKRVKCSCPYPSTKLNHAYWIEGWSAQNKYESRA